MQSGTLLKHLHLMVMQWFFSSEAIFQDHGPGAFHLLGMDCPEETTEEIGSRNIFKADTISENDKGII